MAKTASKTRVTKKQVQEHRTRASKDLSPKWDGVETWTGEQVTRQFHRSMEYYRMESSGKDLKPKVVEWMKQNGFDQVTVDRFRKIKDHRCSGTMGGLAACLLKGMPAQRADFNNGLDSAEWLKGAIAEAIEAGKYDIESVEEETKVLAPIINIQDRLKETSARMVEEIEDAIDLFSKDPETFDPKAFKVLNLLKAKQAKAAHSRIIKGFYESTLKELEEALAGKCEQLKEGYSHLSKSQLKKIIAFYQEVVSACDMLGQEAKVNRKPRAKRPTDKAKVVAKLKYKKTDESLKLVSISPEDIIGAKELWVYNVKTRKIGKYITSEFSELGIKGTSITGYDEVKSVQKTVRKPEEKIKEFKAAGKVQLRKFLDEINSVDIKLNGRINEDVILLKVN